MSYPNPYDRQQDTSYAPLMNGEDYVAPHYSSYAPPSGPPPPSNTAYLAPQPQYAPSRSPPREGSVSPQPTLYGPGGLDREISRTPSPTPSEIEALNSDKLFNVRSKLKEKGKTYTYIFYAVIALLLVITILFAVFQDQIVKALRPATNWVHK
jgi:hypothetical protein